MARFNFLSKIPRTIKSKSKNPFNISKSKLTFEIGFGIFWKFYCLLKNNWGFVARLIGLALLLTFSNLAINEIIFETLNFNTKVRFLCLSKFSFLNYLLIFIIYRCYIFLNMLFVLIIISVQGWNVELNLILHPKDLFYWNRLFSFCVVGLASVA